ncbi:uncharacterized protein SPAPADRAFT_57614 [Spathaspora passalidarum NRRL Y-27907]|uniref:DNA-directed RNA polymerase n=1 Tax=Spathaspora passalidarum (strain NRRL Y-27907 / 11-Y1) TaxID=619300 RepID=G3AVF5_SPAPN|nr:uncharacterized protein SPAPADRAFT_57614 [Spathaspora passalidarum NRRL Y-27907]EGW30174.1 hypothetical protein SPAPADRAFT_57614 [Spathaspora passalidarum NRRL Y-27907]
MTKEKVGIAFAKATIHLYYIANRYSVTKRISPFLVDFLFDNLADFKLELQSVASELSEQYLRDCIITICRRKKITIPTFKQSQPVHDNKFQIALSKYKNEYGSISIHELYKFIQETKFDWNGKIKPNIKLYEFYDTLNARDKHEFMQAYLNFHTEKQAIIEEAMDFIEYIPSEFKQKSNNLISLVYNNNELLNQWISKTSTKIMNMLQVKNPETDQEKLLHQYQSYFVFVPVSLHIHGLLSEILGNVGLYNDGVPIYKIKSQLRYSFDKQMVNAIPFKHNGGIMKYMNRNDRDDLISVFLDVLIESATIEISEDNIKLMKTMTKDVTSEEFLNRNEDGSCPALIVCDSEGSYKYPVIKIHPILENDLSNCRGKVSRFPMVVPPKPWTNLFEGGYLVHKECVFMARFDKTYLNYFKQVSYDGHLDSVFMTLNKLGSLAWAINPDMLKILNRAANMPQGFLKIPRPISDKVPKFKDKFAQQKYISSKGARITFNMLLDMANGFSKNGEMLYTPYQLDFRGRVYPSSNLSHILSDEFRCLFMFWHSKALGNDGFNWLKYHLSSMFGNSGFHMEQAIGFCDKHKQDIIDSAKYPFDGKQWWLKSKTPYQTLSACMELTKVWEFEEQGGNIEEFRTRFPVHQDGSCNGLQHYAALTRDERGGKAVNLLDEPKKQDIYMEVANIVESKLQALIDSPDETERLYAKLGLIVLSRKLVKTTVMTTVYGVTTIGAAGQVRNRIKDFVDDCNQNPQMKGTISEEALEKIQSESFKLGMFLANVILGSISSLFAPATAVQQWLRVNIKRVLSSFNSKSVMYIKNMKPELFEKVFTQPQSLRPIIWKVPSGFPVIQYYVKSPNNQNFQSVLSSVVASQGKRTLSPMSKYKSVNGIAPNYIHSLDAVHMMWTCNNMYNEGLSFAAVHDSFWTHPCDVKRMSTILRQEFVKLHTPDLLMSLRNDLMQQVKGSYQLVQFRSCDFPELAKRIKRLRQTYPCRDNLNEMLYYELTQLEQGTSEISLWIEDYDPKVYFNREEYNSSPQVPEKYVNNGREKTWVFVPVKIQDLPAKGKLDLNRVLQSEFFFH